jgi:hypothetical protein
MHQKNEESLKDFIFRFNKEKLEIDNSDEKTMLNALMRGVKANGPLMAEIAKSSRSITLAQFMNKTEEYINPEELIGTLLKAQMEEDQAKQDGKKIPSVSKMKEEKNSQKAGKKSSCYCVTGQTA